MPVADLTPDQLLAQRLAGTMWAVATSENHEITASDSVAYTSTEAAFLEVVKIAWNLTAPIAKRVRGLLSEYGPDDSLTGTSGHGIASYVEFASDRRNDDYHY